MFYFAGGVLIRVSEVADIIHMMVKSDFKHSEHFGTPVFHPKL